MIDMAVWTKDFLHALDGQFGSRVWFVGLQGSYGRGEATADSDIDMVVILDELRGEDIAAYGAMLDRLPHRERSCGFLSGREEICRWDPADLFQLCYDTIPIRGSLDGLLPLLDEAAVGRAIRMGACNCYHGCVHNMVHGKRNDVLQGLYKASTFVIQAICFRQTGRYLRRLAELREVVSTEDQQIVDTFLYLKNGGAVDFDLMSQLLFTWSGRVIRDGQN